MHCPRTKQIYCAALFVDPTLDSTGLTHCTIETAAVKVELLQLNLAKSRGKKKANRTNKRATERSKLIPSFPFVSLVGRAALHALISPFRERGN